MSSDLISRKALKDKAETVTLWNGDVRRFVSYETIDNAPTVSTEDCEGCPYCPNNNSGIPIGIE